MTAERKQLYRELLHRAMIDMRAVSSSWHGSLRWWWRKKFGQTQALGFVNAYTDWLHNLALYSAWDFEDFNEEWFWRDHQIFRGKYPSDKWPLWADGILKRLEQSAS